MGKGTVAQEAGKEWGRPGLAMSLAPCRSKLEHSEYTSTDTLDYVSVAVV
jgi:hypothetical protein